MSAYPISPAGGLRVVHDGAAVAKILAIPGGVAEGIASEVDEGHGIGAH